MEYCTACRRKNPDVTTMIDPPQRDLPLHFLCDECTRAVYRFLTESDPTRPEEVVPHG